MKISVVHAVHDDLESFDGNILVVGFGQRALVEKYLTKVTLFGDFFEKHIISKNQRSVATEVNRAGNPVRSRPADDNGAAAVYRALQVFCVIDPINIGRKAKSSGI